MNILQLPCNLHPSRDSELRVNLGSAFRESNSGQKSKLRVYRQLFGDAIS